MPFRRVAMPLTGTYVLDVKVKKGATDEDAIKAFWAQFCKDGADVNKIEGWELVEHVTEGWVFHGEQNDVEVEEIDEQEY